MRRYFLMLAMFCTYSISIEHNGTTLEILLYTCAGNELTDEDLSTNVFRFLPINHMASSTAPMSFNAVPCYGIPVELQSELELYDECQEIKDMILKFNKENLILYTSSNSDDRRMKLLRTSDNCRIELFHKLVKYDHDHISDNETKIKNLTLSIVIYMRNILMMYPYVNLTRQRLACVCEYLICYLNKEYTSTDLMYLISNLDMDISDKLHSNKGAIYIIKDLVSIVIAIMRYSCDDKSVHKFYECIKLIQDKLIPDKLIQDKLIQEKLIQEKLIQEKLIQEKLIQDSSTNQSESNHKMRHCTLQESLNEYLQNIRIPHCEKVQQLQKDLNEYLQNIEQMKDTNVDVLIMYIKSNTLGIPDTYQGIKKINASTDYQYQRLKDQDYKKFIRSWISDNYYLINIKD